MANALRMDVYRLFRSTSFWVGLALAIALTLFATFSIWYMGTPEFLDMVEAVEASGGTMSVTAGTEEIDRAEMAGLPQMFQGMDAIQYLGGLLLNGGLLVLIVALIVALFTASEFETGFSKNVFSVQKSRSSYFAAKAVTMLIIILIYLLSACVFGLISAEIVGFGLSYPPVLDIVFWLGLVVLILWAMTMLVSLVAWVFRNKASSIVVALVVTTGILSLLIGSILSLIPSISFLGDYTLFSSMGALGGGMMSLEGTDIVRIACVGLGFLVLYSGLSIIALKKKDI